jgi:kynurenine formamidase
MTHARSKGLWKTDISFHIRDFLIGEHVGTHVDAICHFDPRPGAPCLDKLPLEMFITEALCVDVSHVKPATYIRIDDLKRGLDKVGLAIKKGDTFLYWQDYYARKSEPNWLHCFAGLDWDATQWLADEGVVNIGCECASIDCSAAMGLEAEGAFPAHRTCRERGVLNTENLANLEEVVGKRFLYIGLPLRLVGGTGCPIRAVAMFDS